MKTLFILLAAAPLVCSKTYPDRADIVCYQVPCTAFTTGDKLSVSFKSASYHFFKRTSVIGIHCTIENPTGSAVYLARNRFVISSQKTTYLPDPFRAVQNDKTVTFPDSLKINPGDNIVYVFNYHSADKLTEDAYEELTNTDEADFVYRNEGKERKLFKIKRIQQ